MLEAVIFDFDGIIVYSQPYYYSEMARFLKTLHKGITQNDINDLLGHSFTEKLEYLKTKFGIELSSVEFLSKTADPAFEKLLKKEKPSPVLLSLLKSLKKAGIPLGVATANSKKIVPFVLDAFSISNYFSAVVTTDDVVNSKPAPDVYLKAVQLLGKNPKNCVAIEDTPVGIASAKAAGLMVIAMPTDYSRKLDFSEADLIVSCFDEINLPLLRGFFK